MLMPADPKALELLRDIDVFAKLDEPHAAALAEICKFQKHKAGKVIFRQGDKSDSFHVVSSGKLDCYLWDDLLKIERPLTVFRRGEIFGEVGLLTDDSRSAFVRAQEDCETLVFDKEAFFALLEKNPKVLLNFARILAHRLVAANKAAGIKFDQLASYKIGRDELRMLPLQVILRHRVLPLTRQDSEVTLAIVDPADPVARNTAIQFLNKHKINWVCVSASDFDHFRDKKLFDLVKDAMPAVEPLGEEIIYLTASAGTAPEITSDAARKLEEFLTSAITAGASDLHLEPGPANVAVRARIDGRLVELAPALSYASYKPILSRIKVLAELDIAESRLPQDAVLRIKYGSRNVDLRISTVPTPHAEAVACRLFDPLQRKLDFENLVVSDAVAEVIKKLFHLPSGLVLVTGPTGSGKTTTLYAGLQVRQQICPTHKIVTAEDPIEYELPGVTQVQVNPVIALSYQRILRSLLRQDPEVILVGEIRDRDSMEIAFEAALTGHFVLSSLHTNDAFETMARIRQRGVEPYVAASAIRGIISQRLLPRLCSACAEEAPISQELTRELQRSGICDAGTPVKTWVARGCTHCKMSGYKGRIALYEVLVMSSPLQAAIESGATTAELEKAVQPGSYVSMRRYGRFVMEKGLASPKDILEVLPAQATITRV